MQTEVISMEKNTEIIRDFIRKLIASKSTSFFEKDLQGISVLKGLGIIHQVKEGFDKYELNPNSTSLNKQLLLFAEEKLGRKTPVTLVAAFRWVDDFQESLKEENGVAKNVINAYNDLINNLKAY